MTLRIDLPSLTLRLFFRSSFNSISSRGSIGGSGTPPPPPPDIEEKLQGPPEVPPGAVSQLSPTEHGPASPSSSKATVGDDIKSSSWSFTELLAPATFCTGIFYSIPPMVQQDHHGYWLYELLLAFVFLGVMSSVVAVICARRKSRRREAEAGGNDKESKLLDVGLVYSLFAFVLRILLHFTAATWLRVVMFIFIGSLAGGLYIYLSIDRLSNFIPKRSNGKNVALNHVHMPPELLVDIDVPYEVLKSFYLLPSLMYRVESLMLACQLRKEISFCSSNPIPSFLILEAITTLRCCEDFSMERLELLGDSVLKYAVRKLSSDRIKIIRNATLHSLGTKRGIQGYILDAAFEPRRWVAPGHISIHRVPCKCGLNDNEVPNRILDANSDKSIVIEDTGAYYVGGGLPAALAFIKWLGIDTEFEPDVVEEAIRTASGWTYLPKIHEIETLESKIGYKFTVKGLLLESITHASQQELGVFFCYQRLEFLGDSVLDLLITWHLFQRYKDIDPGELTDLRSASVNNENLAHKVAVRHKLQQHLQHNSGLLLEKITEFVKRLEDSDENKYMLLSNGTSKVPKVLGDMVESIAGAILIDTKLDLDKVWEIFEPLLSPIATPENLELPPLRELTELCSHHGYFLNTTCTNEGDISFDSQSAKRWASNYSAKDTLTGIAELKLHLISTLHDGGRTLRLRFGLLPHCFGFCSLLALTMFSEFRTTSTASKMQTDLLMK
ncbi:Ribonuclease III domain [Musa troglodytarum]|uniref:Ribonuclease III domain n=1 Tax=Musa troglodytarum TaxID=320322 RepID=A0A9E7L9X1_9LILI|nr:Ribonuclease III domain [Musa troglodytarum]